MREALVDINMSYLFKHFKMQDQDQEKLFIQLISEVSILGLESIRDHPNVIKLEGIAWDIQTNDKIQPVLVFEKTAHGDLEAFLSSKPGRELSVYQRLSLCSNIGNAVGDLHSYSE